MISYFDCAATTKPTEQVIKDIETGMRDYWYNPSSISEESRKVKLQIEHARQQVADFINCKPEEIIFTSGATESNNLVMRSNWDIVMCSAIDHPSIYKTMSWSSCLGNYYVPVSSGGQINLDKLEAVLKYIETNDTFTKPKLMCVSYVNNEIGSTENIYEISKLVHHYGVRLFVDATQAIEYRDIDVQSMGIDMLSASFHKFGGVRGCGFFICKRRN